MFVYSSKQASKQNEFVDSTMSVMMMEMEITLKLNLPRHRIQPTLLSLLVASKRKQIKIFASMAFQDVVEIPFSLFPSRGTFYSSKQIFQFVCRCCCCCSSIVLLGFSKQTSR